MATDKMVFNSKSVILDKIMMLISITVLVTTQHPYRKLLVNKA